jgi:signal transduction histidine kinase
VFTLPETLLDEDFPRLVSLACHDLRTPLATVQGFAKTLTRQGGYDERTLRWLSLIDEASDEVVQLLDLLSLSARIESGRYEPVTQEADSLELAQRAVPEASGAGAAVTVDPDAVVRALAGLVRAASRHGGVVASLTVDGTRLAVEPVVPEAAAIVLGDDMRDLGAAVAVRLVRSLGGSVQLEGERVWVVLPG